MGLDAYVACTCYRDGLTSEPPLPRSQLTIDERGDVVLVDDDDDVDVWHAIWNWQESACPHPSMKAASDWVGNIAGISWLRSVASGLPSGRFANLAVVLSGLSGLMDSYLPAADAVRALPELEALLSEDCVGSTRIICADGGVIDNDVDRGFIDHERFRSVDAVQNDDLRWSEVVEIGLQGYDFVLRSRDARPRELLRARILKQEWETTTVESSGARPHRSISLFAFTNIETGDAVRVQSFGIAERLRWPDGSYSNKDAEGDRYLWRYPAMLFVSERKRMVAELWELLVLKSLFETSVLTGNPVVWC